MNMVDMNSSTTTTTSSSTMDPIRFFCKQITPLVSSGHSGNYLV